MHLGFYVPYVWSVVDRHTSLAPWELCLWPWLCHLLGDEVLICEMGVILPSWVCLLCLGPLYPPFTPSPGVRTLAHGLFINNVFWKQPCALISVLSLAALCCKKRTE